MGFLELADTEQVSTADHLELEKARQLFQAAEKNRDVSVVELRKAWRDGELVDEYLILDVETDGVPPMNSVGILYQERIAVRVSAESGSVPESLALREDFPALMHQNQTLQGRPRSLCLYFTEPREVLRTWTGERHLRRIQWWLEHSARGTLHPGDQPVEQMFFDSPIELVLPWNYEKLREGRHQFVVCKTAERSQVSFTCIILPTDHANGLHKVSTVLEITTAPIRHGMVEHQPTELGGLIDILEKRDGGALEKLKESVRELVPEGEGKAPGDDSDFLTLLVRIPIVREEGAEPEGTQYLGMMVDKKPLELGKQLGQLLQSPEDPTYYRERLPGFAEESSWREIKVVPFSVLQQPDQSTARRFSGVPDGFVSTMVGAGSLGSSLLDQWVRSGWGEWSVLDHDHLKPHNLVRHTASSLEVGQSKAHLAAQRGSAATFNASAAKALSVSACDLENPEVQSTLENSSAVIDVSTSLEYPRLASVTDWLPRHASAFVTPDGNGAVVLLEPKDRSIRLIDLEAQYYRAIINDSWGEAHLVGADNRVRIGNGCRDVSVVMPYSKILAHAGNIGDILPQLMPRDNASMYVWQRNPQDGSVEAIHLPTSRRACLSNATAENILISEDVMNELQAAREKALPNETGGILLGFVDFNINTIVVVEGNEAGSDSKRSRSFFERGTEGMRDYIAEVERRTAGIVGYIGEWHSHPHGRSASQSDADANQLQFVSDLMSAEGFPAVQLIVGEKESSAYVHW